MQMLTYRLTLVEPLELGKMKLKCDGFNQASVLSFSRPGLYSNHRI